MSSTTGPILRVEVTDELVEAVAQRAAEIVRDLEPTPDEWLTTESVAAYLKCSKGRVHNLTSEGRIPYHKEGNRLLFRKSAIDHWVASGRAKSA